jgi:putative DNA primase/helicase
METPHKNDGLESAIRLLNGADAFDADDGVIGAVSDDRLAEEFTREYRGRALYCAAWGRWLLWDGRRWAIDEKLKAFDMARHVCREVLQEMLTSTALTERQRAALISRLGSAQTIAAVLKIAASSPVHAVAADELDADAWLLNTPGGILDLRDGSMRPHDPAAKMTKITAAAPGGECPTFMRTLARVLPDPAVRDYVQRFAGYALTGVVREHVLPLWYGSGGNGKSSIINAIQHVLGDYAITMNPEVLMESRNDRHPTEIAVLRGVRLAVCSEIDSGRQWNESRVKRLTGGDPITARYIARDPFEFQPSHKLIVVANNKPGLKVVDEAIKRRINLVHFGVTIPEDEQDSALPDKLREEAPGILAWALVGCLDWQEAGLAPPEAVRAATAGYFEAEDTIAQWISECCERRGQVTLKAAHASYRAWCDTEGATPMGRNNFGDQLEAKGFRRVEIVKRHWVFQGLSLPTVEDARYGD